MTIDKMLVVRKIQMIYMHDSDYISSCLVDSEYFPRFHQVSYYASTLRTHIPDLTSGIWLYATRAIPHSWLSLVILLPLESC